METETEQTYKYLPNGRAVVLVQHLENGTHLVAPVMVRAEEDGESDDIEFIDYDRPFVTKELFDSEPEFLFSPKIEALEQRIHELRKEKDAMELAKRNLSTEEAQIKARCAAIPALQHVFDYIDGKITHYVMDDYSGPRIVAFGDTKAEYAKVRDGKRLLSLYGDSQGNLQYRLSHYSDGSGGSVECYPAMSYEEAVQKCAELIELKLSTNCHNDSACIKSADALGIPVKSEYRERHRKADLNSAEDMLARSQASLNEWKAKVEALKS